MEVINSANIEDAPLKNMFEALSTYSLELQPSFNIDSAFPQIIIDDENRQLNKRTGASDSSFMVTFEISIVADNIIDTKTLSSELRTLITSSESELARYNMDLYEILSSPSILSRGDKIYPVRNFNVKYVVG